MQSSSQHNLSKKNLYAFLPLLRLNRLVKRFNNVRFSFRCSLPFTFSVCFSSRNTTCELLFRLSSIALVSFCFMSVSSHFVELKSSLIFLNSPLKLIFPLSHSCVCQLHQANAVFEVGCFQSLHLRQFQLLV